MTIYQPSPELQAFQTARDVAMCYAASDVDATNQASMQLANQLALMQPSTLQMMRAAARVLLNAASTTTGLPMVCISRSCPSQRCPSCGNPEGRPVLTGPAGQHRHGRYVCPEWGCEHSPHGHGDSPAEVTRLADEWMTWTNGRQ